MSTKTEGEKLQEARREIKSLKRQLADLGGPGVDSLRDAVAEAKRKKQEEAVEDVASKLEGSLVDMAGVPGALKKRNKDYVNDEMVGKVKEEAKKKRVNRLANEYLLQTNATTLDDSEMVRNLTDFVASGVIESGEIPAIIDRIKNQNKEKVQQEIIDRLMDDQISDSEARNLAELYRDEYKNMVQAAIAKKEIEHPDVQAVVDTFLDKQSARKRINQVDYEYPGNQLNTIAEYNTLTDAQKQEVNKRLQEAKPADVAVRGSEIDKARHDKTPGNLLDAVHKDISKLSLPAEVKASLLAYTEKMKEAKDQDEQILIKMKEALSAREVGANWLKALKIAKYGGIAIGVGIFGAVIAGGIGSFGVASLTVPGGFAAGFGVGVVGGAIKYRLAPKGGISEKAAIAEMALKNELSRGEIIKLEAKAAIRAAKLEVPIDEMLIQILHNRNKNIPIEQIREAVKRRSNSGAATEATKALEEMGKVYKFDKDVEISTDLPGIDRFNDNDDMDED